MAAYLIVNVDVKDPSAYEKYKAAAPALIRKHGGEYLVRGGTLEVLEGGWRPSRLVLFRFPNKESVEALFRDPEYQPLKALRQRAAKAEIVVVEGAGPAARQTAWRSPFSIAATISSASARLSVSGGERISTLQ